MFFFNQDCNKTIIIFNQEFVLTSLQQHSKVTTAVLHKHLKINVDYSTAHLKMVHTIKCTSVWTIIQYRKASSSYRLKDYSNSKISQQAANHAISHSEENIYSRGGLQYIDRDRLSIVNLLSSPTIFKVVQINLLIFRSIKNIICGRSCLFLKYSFLSFTVIWNS